MQKTKELHLELTKPSLSAGLKIWIDVLLLRRFIIATAFTHLGEIDDCCGDGMLSFLGELGRDEEILGFLLPLVGEFSSFLAKNEKIAIISLVCFR